MPWACQNLEKIRGSRSSKSRWDNREALNAIIEEWTMRRTKRDVARILGDAGVPCGACQDTSEVMADPHLLARDMIVDIEDYPARNGAFKTVGCPIKLSETPVNVTRPPTLGEHSGDVLADLCGLDDNDIRRLRDEGVI